MITGVPAEDVMKRLPLCLIIAVGTGGSNAYADDVSLPCGQWKMNLIAVAQQSGQSPNTATGWTEFHNIQPNTPVGEGSNGIAITSNKVGAGAGIAKESACEALSPGNERIHFKFVDSGFSRVGHDEWVVRADAGWQPFWQTKLTLPTGAADRTLVYSVNIALRGGDCQWSAGTTTIHLGSNKILSDQRLTFSPGATYDILMKCSDSSPAKRVSNLNGGPEQDVQTVEIVLQVLP
jgi:hypothetical protein